MRRFRKNTCAALGAVIFMLGASACGGGDPKSDPSPSPTTSSTPPTSSSPTPTWDNKFSPADLQRYEAAKSRWLEFWAFYTDAAHKGVDTPAVKAGFEKYSMTALGDYSNFLDIYVRGGVRMEVPPKVLWTNASKIGDTTVVFNYCLDSTNERDVNTNGDVNPNNPPYRQLVTVQMRKTDKGWMKETYLHGSKVRTCGPSAP